MKTKTQVQIKIGRCFKTGRSPVLVAKWVDGAWLSKSALEEEYDKIDMNMDMYKKCYIHQSKKAIYAHPNGWGICQKCFTKLHKNFMKTVNQMVDDGAPEGFEKLPEEVFSIAAQKSLGSMPESLNQESNFFGNFGDKFSAPKKKIKEPKKIGTQVLQITELRTLLAGNQHSESIKPISKNAEQNVEKLMAAISSGKPMGAQKNLEDTLKGKLREHPEDFKNIAWVETKLQVFSGVEDPETRVEQWSWSDEAMTQVACSGILAELKPKDREHMILNAAKSRIVWHQGRVHVEEHYIGKHPCWVFSYAWVDVAKRKFYKRVLKQPFCYG